MAQRFIVVLYCDALLWRFAVALIVTFKAQ